MQFIFAPVLGRLSDQVGRRPVLLFSLLGSAIGFLVMGLAGSLPVLFVARIIDGVSGGNISTAQAYIADVTPPEQRSRGMGLIGAAFGLGFIVGPALGGALTYISPGAPFFFAAGLAGINAVALYFLLPESLSAENRSRAETRMALTTVVREAGSWSLIAIMATYFFATVAFAMLTTTYALFANHRYGFEATDTGLVFAYVGLLGAVIQGGLLGRLLKVTGDKMLAVIGIALFAVSLFALPYSSTVVLFLIASTGIAIGNSFTTPTLNGLASKSVNATWQGRILGAMSSVASLARFIGPGLGGWLLQRDRINPSTHYGRTPYWVSALLMLVALILAVTVNPTEAHQTVRTGDQKEPNEDNEARQAVGSD
jgi:multidrug resistance protein